MVGGGVEGHPLLQTTDLFFPNTATRFLSACLVAVPIFLFAPPVVLRPPAPFFILWAAAATGADFASRLEAVVARRDLFLRSPPSSILKVIGDISCCCRYRCLPCRPSTSLSIASGGTTNNCRFCRPCFCGSCCWSRRVAFPSSLRLPAVSRSPAFAGSVIGSCIASRRVGEADGGGARPSRQITRGIGFFLRRDNLPAFPSSSRNFFSRYSISLRCVYLPPTTGRFPPRFDELLPLSSLYLYGCLCF